jgi:hypothetical protein
MEAVEFETSTDLPCTIRVLHRLRIERDNDDPRLWRVANRTGHLVQRLLTRLRLYAGYRGSNDEEGDEHEP